MNWTFSAVMTAILLAGSSPILFAQQSRSLQRVGSCDFSSVPGVVWWGTERRMTM
jgi:hypothetical protein